MRLKGTLARSVSFEVPHVIPVFAIWRAHKSYTVINIHVKIVLRLLLRSSYLNSIPDLGGRLRLKFSCLIYLKLIEQEARMDRSVLQRKIWGSGSCKKYKVRWIPVPKGETKSCEELSGTPVNDNIFLGYLSNWVWDFPGCCVFMVCFRYARYYSGRSNEKKKFNKQGKSHIVCLRISLYVVHLLCQELFKLVPRSQVCGCFYYWKIFWKTEPVMFLVLMRVNLVSFFYFSISRMLYDYLIFVDNATIV